ncbi:MAG: LacI family transcriptional regulator [Chloroflexi bacterium]|nr:LacI family transcriptional regulator [Chloroflexota bacterium]
MSTIRDVANKAGVHPSTVSRVFSGKSQISDSTRKRVLKAAEELGFQPNAIARSLSMQRTNTIAIVISHAFQGYFEDTYFPHVMQGLLEVTYKYGYRVLVGGSGGHSDEITQLFDIVGSRQADGILVLSNRLDVDIVAALRNQETPFVLLGKPLENHDDIAWVDSDDAVYTHKIIQYLLGMGHRRVAYVGGDPDVFVTRERLRGYQLALQEAGIEPLPEWIDYGFFVEDGGRQAVRRMARLGELAPTAYYAANDLMAVGIMRALQEQGLRIPEDVSVIGTNNSLLAANTTPALTSLAVPYAVMAAKATSILIQAIQAGVKPNKQTTVSCKLIIRQSAGPPPAPHN